MNGKYVGYVAGHDPLHGFLSRIIRDHLGVREPQPAFRVFRLSGSNEVYAYEEKFSGTRSSASSTARGSAGPGQGSLDGTPGVRGPQDAARVRPGRLAAPCDPSAGRHRDINGVLALEYYAGEEFSQAIERATQGHDDAHLYWRLKALAYFLATQHNRTANGATVDFDPDCRYFDRSSAGCDGPPHRAVGRRRALLAARPLAGPAADVGGPAGLAARRRDSGELPVRPRPGRRRDRPGTDEARRPDVRRRAGRRRAPARVHARPGDGAARSRSSAISSGSTAATSPIASRRSSRSPPALPYYMALNLLRIARNDYIGRTTAEGSWRRRRSCCGRRLNAGPSSPGPHSPVAGRGQPGTGTAAGLHWPGRRADRAHHALPG